MADEEKKLTDQFNILFDDITDDLTEDVKEGAEELAEKAEETASEAASSVESAVSEGAEAAADALQAQAEDTADAGEDLYSEVANAFSDAEDAFSEAVTEAGDAEEALKTEIPEKQKKAKKPFVREDPKSLLDELNQEDEDRYEDEEADDFDEEEAPRKKSVNKPPYDGEDKSRRKGMSAENLRFWIFTAIVALLVIAAVLFILYKRGIIFSHDDTTTTAATTAAPKTTEPTTLAPVETTTAVEETTTVVEETTTEVPEEVREVLNHYTNLFVVRDKVGDAEVNYLNIRAQASAESSPIARIARYGGGEVLEDGAEWVKISSAGYVGYVKKEYVATGEEAKEMALQRADKYVRATAENGLRIRSMPSTTGEIVTTVPNGAIMIYEGEEDGFYHINYGDQFDGYVSADHAVYEWLLMGAIPNE